ncbi:hypothetical protein VTI74DRAFT_3125 [Chaetomium olivicolor]
MPVAFLFAVYIAFTPRRNEGAPVKSLPQLLEEHPSLFSLQVVGMLVAVLVTQALAFSVPSFDLVPTIALCLTKAGCWCCVLEAVCHLISFPFNQPFKQPQSEQSSWGIAAAIWTFGMVAGGDPFIQFTKVQAILPVISSFLIIAQITAMIPRQAKGRAALQALILVYIVPYLANVFALRVSHAAAIHTQEHSIEVLIRRARADFEAMMQRQSKTYADVVEEYQHRYRVEPPPGFEDWYKFAKENASPIIDDFDTIYDTVSPFWKLTGSEVAWAMTQVYNTKDIDLWRCTFTGKTGETHCTRPSRRFDRHISRMFSQLLGDVRGQVPDVTFLVNHLDEPRVLIPQYS